MNLNGIGTLPGMLRPTHAEPRTRIFFARVGSMGPLTYGHLLNSARTDQPVMRGGRLDVKA